MVTHRDPTYYYEDLTVGEEYAIGSKTYTKAEIVAFAEQYDPQWFHLDEAAAEDSVFGGLVASGLQTLCLANRMATEEFHAKSALVGGFGLDVSFPRPVWPGDVITFTLEIDDKEPREGRPDQGTVDLRLTARNQDGDLVMDTTSHTIFRRRES